MHFWGSVQGKAHDTTLRRLSKLHVFLDEHSDIFLDRFIYGDPAYSVNKYMISPFKGSHLSDAKCEFNRSMSRVRECVEWSFGRMKTL